MLTHAHSSECSPERHPGEESGHMPFQCCHCRGLDPQAQMTMAEDDALIQERLRTLGINGRSAIPGDSFTPPVVDETQDPDVPVEDKYITGHGPTGPSWGPGRGHLTFRQEWKVLTTVEYRAYLAEHGGGERE